MSRWARGATGLILGVVAGFFIAVLLNDLVLQHGHTVPGSIDAVIIFAVASLAFLAGIDPARDDR